MSSIPSGRSTGDGIREHRTDPGALPAGDLAELLSHLDEVIVGRQGPRKPEVEGRHGAQLLEDRPRRRPERQRRQFRQRREGAGAQRRNGDTAHRRCCRRSHGNGLPGSCPDLSTITAAPACLAMPGRNGGSAAVRSASARTIGVSPSRSAASAAIIGTRPGIAVTLLPAGVAQHSQSIDDGRQITFVSRKGDRAEITPGAGDCGPTNRRY